MFSQIKIGHDHATDTEENFGIGQNFDTALEIFSNVLQQPSETLGPMAVTWDPVYTLEKTPAEIAMKVDLFPGVKAETTFVANFVFAKEKSQQTFLGSPLHSALGEEWRATQAC